MSEMKISHDVMLRELMIKNQWLENRLLILAQGKADAEKRVAELETQLADQPT